MREAPLRACVRTSALCPRPVPGERGLRELSGAPQPYLACVEEGPAPQGHWFPTPLM